MTAVATTTQHAMTGEELATKLDKDFASMQRTYNRHREKKTELPPLSKNEDVDDITVSFLTQLYSGGQSKEHRQTPIRVLEKSDNRIPEYPNTRILESDLKDQYDKKLQRERQRIETDAKQAVQEQIAKAVEAERIRIEDQYADRLSFADERVKLNVESVRAKVELALRDELDATLKAKTAAIEADYQAQFESKLSFAEQQLIADFEAEQEAQREKPFFEKKGFAVAVLLITMSVQMYEVALFIKATFNFTDLWLSSVWAGAFQFGGLMMTIHIGNHEKFYKSFLFWFATLSVVIDLFVLLPENTGAWNIPARILFAVMFPLIEFAYGKIYLKLK